MRAVFLFNLAQWEAWRPHATSEDYVLTTDVDVFAASRSAQVPVADLAGFLTDDQLKLERDAALRLCDMLGDALQEVMPEPHSSISRHLSHELLYPLGHYLQIMAMAKRAVEQLAPSSAFAFAEDRRVFFWDPPSISPDLANDAVNWALASHGMPVERATCPYSEPTSSVQAADQQHVWLPIFEPVLEPATTVVVGQGMWWSEMDAILANASSRRSPMSAVSTSWINYVLPQNERTDPDVVARTDHAVRFVAHHTPQMRLLLERPVMRSLMSAWSGVIEHAVRYYEFGRQICRALAPKVVIHGYDVRAPQRCFAQAVMEGGAIPISILHGGINGMDHEGVRHWRAVGHLAAWSNRDVQTLAPYRDPSFEIRAIGSFRSDITRLMAASREPAHAISLDSARNPKIVFLTCRISGLYWFSTRIDRHVSAWEDIRRLFERRTDWDGLIKKHPRYDHQYLYGDDRLSSNLRVADIPLEQALDGAHAVVMVNLETTAALEAIGRGIPVLHLNTATRGEPDRWVRDSGVRALRSQEELEAEIERIVSDRDYAVACAELQRSRLDEFVAATGPHAVGRLEAWIAELSSNGRAAKPNPSACFRLRFAQWIDRIFLSDANAPPPTATGIEEWGDSLPAAHILHRVTWYPWPASPASRARALWRVYIHMPRAGRTSPAVFRRYMIECLLQDARNPLRSAFARVCARVLARLLAPCRRA